MNLKIIFEQDLSSYCDDKVFELSKPKNEMENSLKLDKPSYKESHA